MSREVKRYELRIVDRYAGDGTGDIETDARMKSEAKGRYVLFSDYAALLAESERLREALVTARDWIDFSKGAVGGGYLILEEVDAALQGEQP